MTGGTARHLVTGTAGLLAASAVGWWLLQEDPVGSPPPPVGGRSATRDRDPDRSPRREDGPALPPSEGTGSRREDPPPLPSPAPEEKKPAALPPTAISGTMVSSSGRPLPRGFQAVIFRETNLRQAETVVPVAPDGTFATAALPDGESFLVVGRSAMGFTAGNAKGILSGTRDLRVELATGGTISGRVLDREGKPVGAGVEVFASINNPAPHRHGSSGMALTAEDGTFVVEYLGEYPFGLVATRESAGKKERGTALDIRPDAVGVDLRLE